MRYKGFAGLGFVIFLAAGCGSGREPNCDQDGDCARGTVCSESKICQERLCTSAGDCSSADQLCVSGALVGKDETKKFCTARECGGGVQCTAPAVCEGGLCVAQGEPSPEVIEDAGPDVPGPTDPGPGETAVDIGPPPVLGDACKPCATDGDCDDGSKCTPVGATKHCLPGCATAAECPKGFLCYPASSSGKACIPVGYDCAECIAEAPCGEGQCCDFVNGGCKACKGECAKCSADFECDEGLRCYKAAAGGTGVCVAECGDAKPCADTTKFACTVAGDVKLCTPTGDTCKGCEPPTPFPSDDGEGCWECRTGLDCKDPAKPNCRLSDHTCQAKPDACELPTHDCSSDPENPDCQRCCEDSHCPLIDGQQKCRPDKTCVGEDDPCLGACEPPFDVCALIGGEYQCVQCSSDTHCAGLGAACKCNTASYTCLDQATGEVCTCPDCVECTAICVTDADCPPSSEGAALSCAADASQPFCYDPSGACDSISSCCGAGQSCIDLIGLLFGGLMGGGGMPGMPTIPTGGSGYCSCDDTHPCLGGQNCQDLSGIIELVGPLIGIDTSNLDIPKMCGNPLGGLGI